ncbi:hypothetical protein [Ferrimonas marina]|uniref:Uncharacterized protein n=2 Tax=Ferrimonas marina TaxID=299255 RepID=A0A1M5UEV9_9GAMM|nr:hypothetical protein [Ferrimonas marina]SHH61497.1 hypothetical protein SAMN02745129_2535 [Ferrimonas marina]
MAHEISRYELVTDLQSVEEGRPAEELAVSLADQVLGSAEPLLISRGCLIGRLVATIEFGLRCQMADDVADDLVEELRVAGVVC